MLEHCTEQAVKQQILMLEDSDFICAHRKAIAQKVQSAVSIVRQRGLDAYDASYLYLSDSYAGDQRDGREMLRVMQEIAEEREAGSASMCALDPSPSRQGLECSEILALRLITRADVETRIARAVYRAVHALCDTVQVQESSSS